MQAVFRWLLCGVLAILVAGCQVSSPAPSTAWATAVRVVAASPVPVGTPTPKPSPSGTAAATATDRSTSTSTSVPVDTATGVPTQTTTPVPLYLPGMVGFLPSPTWDASQVQTPPLAQPPACPEVDESLPLSDELAEILANPPGAANAGSLLSAVLQYLNTGGSPAALVEAFQAAGSDPAFEQDLTHDGQPELVLELGRLLILGCSPDGSGAYAGFGEYWDGINSAPAEILAIRDLNLNGKPELLLAQRAHGGFSTAMYLRIVEWNGQEFSDMLGLPPAYPYRSLVNIRDVGPGITYDAPNLGEVGLRDVDGNGTIEIIVPSGIPVHSDTLAHGPWRRGVDTFTWNGKWFVFLRSQIDPPVYRFQAVHDADQAALLGEYDRALMLYQEAVFSNRLRGWSPELSRQQFDTIWVVEGTPTLTPVPAPVEEYGHLAGYARFRIVALHALRGFDGSAQTVYNTLQEKFPEGQPGHTSAVLAQAFWQEYQASRDVSQACRYAVEMLGEGAGDIIYWLSSYHGWQAPYYEDVDLCPFGQVR